MAPRNRAGLLILRQRQARFFVIRQHRRPMSLLHRRTLIDLSLDPCCPLAVYFLRVANSILQICFVARRLKC